MKYNLARGQQNDKKKVKNVNQKIFEKMHQVRRVQQVKCFYGIFSHMHLTDIFSSTTEGRESTLRMSFNVFFLLSCIEFLQYTRI